MAPTTPISFYVDPACPWTWITSRWLVAVAPERNLDIRWRSFSTEVRDGGVRLSDAIPEHVRPQALARRALERSVLAIFEAIRSQHGEMAVGRFYAELGYRLNDPERPGGPPPADLVATALSAANLNPELEKQAGDPGWQDLVRESTEEAMAFVGRDAMAPVIALEGNKPVGISGPVVSPMPVGDEATRLWDAIRVLLENPNFFEIRRSRSWPPQFPLRPEPSMPAAARRA